ncbi:MAG: DMT family transporter [Succinivibrio sp.]
MNKKNIIGHSFASLVVLFWGMTFVSSKVLLKDFSPIEILFDRFVIATLVLLFFAPKALKFISLKAELYAAGVGFFGVTLYFIFENSALVYSNASNVSLIVSTTPFFVALCNRLIDKEQHLGGFFFLGFVIAMAGIACLSLSTLKLELNPLGDVLALGCAVVWGFYNLYFSKLHALGVSTLYITTKSFFYSVILTIPCMLFYGYELKAEQLLKPVNIVNYLFLAVIASSLSFLIWNKAITYLGVVRTNVYIYAVPAVTAVGAIICIDEKLTEYTLLGMILAIAGLIISQIRPEGTNGRKS